MGESCVYVKRMESKEILQISTSKNARAYDALTDN